jgi:hypothetical protein
VTKWQEADYSWTLVFERQLSSSDGVEPGVVVVTEHDSLGIASGSRGVNKRATMSWGLDGHSTLQIVGDFRANIKIDEFSPSTYSIVESTVFP